MAAPFKPAINNKLQWGKEFLQPAIDTIDDWGRTELYTTGDPVIDEYLGESCLGGYGRKNGYEILTIFGATGMSKSTFATSMILPAAENGVQVGYFALEDDPKDVARRIYIQNEKDAQRASKTLENIYFLPENSGYTLSQMAETIQETFKQVDIIVVDPIQFIFEASVEERGETEFNRQRLFMRQMNNVMKATNKTLILVSHTSKGGDTKNAKTGLDRIIGSSAIAQVSTKAIEINRKDGVLGIRLWKSRFTPYRHAGIAIKLDNMRVRYAYDTSDLKEVRANWRGETNYFGV